MCFLRFFGNSGKLVATCSEFPKNRSIFREFGACRHHFPEKNAVFREIVLIRDYFCRLDPKKKYKWPFFLSIFKKWFFVFSGSVLIRDSLRDFGFPSSSLFRQFFSEARSSFKLQVYVLPLAHKRFPNC